MRMLVFFDLPVQTKSQRKAAAKFRSFLLSDGYYMVQYSVYARVCNSYDTVEKHHARLKGAIPNDGAIRLLVITEKQSQKMELLLGKPSPDDQPMTSIQLELF